MKIVRARSEKLRELAYLLCKGEEEIYGELCRESDAVWVVLDKGLVVAAAGADLVPDHPVFVSMTFCVVTPTYRGRGLQGRLMDARVKWAKRENVEMVKTYAHKKNQPSIRNLNEAGFVVSYFEDPYVYFRKEI